MIQCRLEHEKMSDFKGILTVLICVAAVAVIWFIFGFISYVTKIAFFQLGAFVAVVAGAYLFARAKLVKYIYTINDGSFFVDRQAGRKPKNIAECELKSIEWMGDFASLPESYARSRRERGTYKKLATGRAVVFDDEGKKKCVIITPSDRFWQRLTDMSAAQNTK